MLSPGDLLFLFFVILGSDLSKSRKILGLDLRGSLILAVDADLLRSVDAQANLVAADINDRDLDVVADHDRFIALTGQHQHVQAPSCYGSLRKAGRPSFGRVSPE